MDQSTVARMVFIGFVASALTLRVVVAQHPVRPLDVAPPAIGVDPTAGWQRFESDECHAMVPESWRHSAEPGSVSAPDGSNLSIRMFRTASWLKHKAQIKAAFVHLNLVHEDSDHRLWFEFGKGQLIQHYISSTDGSRICSGLLEIRTRTPASEVTAHRIAGSIGPDSGPRGR